jgi:hypothetical protein
MSAVYILAWLATAYGAAHLIVKWHDASRAIDDAICEVLDAPTESDSGHCAPCADQDACACPSCEHRRFMRDLRASRPDPNRDQTGAAS